MIKKPILKDKKKYSKTHHKSVSQLIADYLYLITEKDSVTNQVEHLPPLTQSLKGILRGKKINEANYKKYLEDKYL